MTYETGGSIMNQKKFNFDYSKTLWMKMFLAKPDWEKKHPKFL